MPEDTTIYVMRLQKKVKQLEARINLALSCIQTGQSHVCDLCEDYLDEAECALEGNVWPKKAELKGEMI